MLIFLLLFGGVFSIAVGVFGLLFASVSAVASLGALVVLGCIALAITMKNNRLWGYMFVAIIVIVAVEVLAPFESFIEIVVSAAIAGYGTFHIKRTINHYVTRAKSMPEALKTIIRFI